MVNTLGPEDRNCSQLALKSGILPYPRRGSVIWRGVLRECLQQFPCEARFGPKPKGEAPSAPEGVASVRYGCIHHGEAQELADPEAHAKESG